MRISCILLFLFYSVYTIAAFDPVPDKSLNGRIENISRFSTGGRIYNPPVYDKTGRLFIFSEDSRFYIFENTKVVKKVKLTSSLLFPVAKGRDNTLYGCFKDRSLRSYNRGGMLLWLKKLDAFPLSPPIVNSYGNLIIFLSDNSVVSYALNGRLRWKKEIKISSEINAVSYRNGIIFNNNNSQFLLLSDRGIISPIPDSSKQKSYFSESGLLFSVEKNNKNSQSDHNISESSLFNNNQKKDFIFSLLDRNMKKLWSAEIKGLPLDISINHNNLYIITGESSLYRFDLSGHIKAKKRVDSGNMSRFLILDKYIYLLNQDGYLKVYNLNFDFIDRILIPHEAVRGMDGRADSPELFPQLCFSGGNSILIGGLDWILYFFSISDTDSAEDKYPELPDETNNYILTDRLKYINELSKSERYENRLKSLNLLEELIDQGGMNKYEYEILDILFKLGTEGTINLSRNNNIIAGGTDIRSRAADLIYSAGTEQSYSMLRKMISAENDEYVMIKCIYLLGRGGSDSELNTLQVFREILEKTAYNIRICYEVVSASENIAAYHGFLPEKYSRLLLGMMDIHADKNLKNKIIKLLVNKQK